MSQSKDDQASNSGNKRQFCKLRIQGHCWKAGMHKAKPRILYAEDETLIADMVESFLTDAGFDALVAHDGEQAAQLLAQHSDDLAGLVTDVQLGRGPNGWDLARRARVSNPQLPIIYTPGDSAHQWTAEGVPHSLSIEKPFVESQLLAALDDLVDGPSPTITPRHTRTENMPGSPTRDDELRAVIAVLTKKLADLEALRDHGTPPTPANELTDEKLASIAMPIYRARRRRSKFFDASLFSEPAWDMLLDLFIASVHGRKVSTTSLCRAAEVYEAPGLRWIGILESQGLIRRRSVSEEGDLKLVEISDSGFAAMRNYVVDGVMKFEMPTSG
jgi:DNA-binding response OmpR family regulator